VPPSRPWWNFVPAREDGGITGGEANIFPVSKTFPRNNVEKFTEPENSTGNEISRSVIE
jgi:hypothetical protein